MEQVLINALTVVGRSAKVIALTLPPAAGVSWGAAVFMKGPLMSNSRRLFRAPDKRRKLTATLLASSLLVAVAAFLPALPANAATSVTPLEAGTPPVVRDGSVKIAVDRTAQSFYRANATSNFAAVGASAFVLNTQTCRGDNPAGTNNSPRTTVTVTDPNGVTVLTERSPVRDLSLAGAFKSPPQQPLVPQPAPSNTNYRGDLSGNAYHGMSADFDLAGKPAGIYTVTTTNQNMVKTGTSGAASACTIGTPKTIPNDFTAGLDVTSTTFEYRPWKFTFKDVLGNGSVSANSNPAEFTFKVGTKTTPIYAGTSASQKFYSLTGGFALPSDPAECAADPSTCLPADATACNPSAGCTPRLMIINRPKSLLNSKALLGVFDLETKAFVAYAEIDGAKRYLLSVGTENDAKYQALLNGLETSAAAKGIDLASILATTVIVDAGGTSNRTSLSLLNGLQIDPSEGKGGVQISSTAEVQAGIILHINSSLRLEGTKCVENKGDSDATTAAPDRYTRNEDNGYTVTKSDLLPSVPKVGPLGVIVGGPVYHIVGKFNSNALINTASAVIGLDTAVGEPNGYPVWVEPFVSSPTHVATPKTMDFLGTATWSASETPVGATGCLVVDYMLGTGVALFNNPLPVGLGTIFDPAAKPTPAAQQLTDKVDEAIVQVTDLAATNPAVSSLLDQVLALLPLA